MRKFLCSPPVEVRDKNTILTTLAIKKRCTARELQLEMGLMLQQMKQADAYSSFSSDGWGRAGK
jgi:hypothetical protein